MHNEGKGRFAGLMADQARRTGVSGYPGDGAQRWPSVHALGWHPTHPSLLEDLEHPALNRAGTQTPASTPAAR